MELNISYNFELLFSFQIPKTNKTNKQNNNNKNYV